MEKIQLELTFEQAEALAQAADLHVRISMGQLERIGEMVMENDGILPVSYNGMMSIGELVALRDRVNPHLLAAKRALGHPANGSFGIGHENVSEAAHRNYEILKVLQKTMFERLPGAETRFKGPMSDGLLVRYTEDPAPVATVVDVPEPEIAAIK